jgi:DNA-directed RNA polymerase alpha subunit
MQYSEADLLKTKNFGQTSLQELRTKLGSLGLSLRK